MKKVLACASLASCLAFSPLVMSHSKGDMLVRVGLSSAQPDDASSNIVVGTDLGFGLGVDGNSQLGLNFAYFISDRMNIEVLASTPFKHDVNFAAPNPLGTGNQLGEVTHLPPTVTLNYYFSNTSSLFQPYAGIGINYTLFFDEKFTEANQAAGLADLSLDNSLGLTAQLGFDYMLDKTWSVNGSVRWIDIDSEASFNLSGTPGRVDSINIDPLVYTISVGYSF